MAKCHGAMLCTNNNDNNSANSLPSVGLGWASKNKQLWQVLVKNFFLHLWK